MKLDKKAQMSDVLRVLYDREHQAIVTILAREAELRSNLRRLDELTARNKETGNNSHMLNAVGATLLWQGWIARTRHQLNSELARVMATKLAGMDRVRIAFGRQRAVELMISADLRERKNRIRKKEVWTVPVVGPPGAQA